MGVACCLMCSAVVWAQQQQPAIDERPFPAWEQDEITISGHSVQEVSDILGDCKSYNKLFPHIYRSVGLSKSECYLETKVYQDILWMRVQVNKRTGFDKKTVDIEIRKLSGNVPVFEGKIALSEYQQEKGTRVFLGLRADPGLPHVLNSIVQGFIRNNVLRKTLVNLQVRMLLGKY